MNLVSDLVKKALLGLRRFLAIEIPLKIIKKTFCFNFVLAFQSYRKTT